MSYSYEYYKVNPNRSEYLGERYFKFSHEVEKVVQICLTCGDVKKGKSNTFGIYLIHKMTLYSNYLATGYLLPCTKREYEKQFKKVLVMLYS